MTRKFNVDGDEWVKAAEGQQGAHDLILKHCELDVLLTEEMGERLKSLIVHITR